MHAGPDLAISRQHLEMDVRCVLRGGLSDESAQISLAFDFAALGFGGRSAAHVLFVNRDNRFTVGFRNPLHVEVREARPVKQRLHLRGPSASDGDYRQAAPEDRDKPAVRRRNLELAARTGHKRPGGGFVNHFRRIVSRSFERVRSEGSRRCRSRFSLNG